MEFEKELTRITERVKQRRIELELSYQDLADRTGLSKSTLQRYETGGIKNLPIDKFGVIARALNVSPAYLMGWDDEINYDDTTLDLTRNFTIDKDGNLNYETQVPIFPVDWPQEMIDKINEYIELLKPKYNVE